MLQHTGDAHKHNACQCRYVGCTYAACSSRAIRVGCFLICSGVLMTCYTCAHQHLVCALAVHVCLCLYRVEFGLINVTVCCWYWWLGCAPAADKQCSMVCITFHVRSLYWCLLSLLPSHGWYGMLVLLMLVLCSSAGSTAVIISCCAA